MELVEEYRGYSQCRRSCIREYFIWQLGSAVWCIWLLDLKYRLCLLNHAGGSLHQLLLGQGFIKNSLLASCLCSWQLPVILSSPFSMTGSLGISTSKSSTSEYGPRDMGRNLMDTTRSLPDQSRQGLGEECECYGAAVNREGKGPQKHHEIRRNYCINRFISPLNTNIFHLLPTVNSPFTFTILI